MWGNTYPIHAPASTYLEFVLVIDVRVTQLSELVCHQDTLIDALWRHEIARDLYATVQSPDLVGRARRNKYGIALELQNTEHLDAVVGSQRIHHVGVNVADLVVNRIGVPLLLPFLAQLAIVLCEWNSDDYKAKCFEKGHDKLKFRQSN